MLSSGLRSAFNLFKRPQLLNITPAISPCETLHVQRRGFQITGAVPSPTMGLVKPYKGFVSNDVEIGLSGLGGQYSRGLVAKRKIAYGREIICVPAFATCINDATQRDQIYTISRQVFSEMVEKGINDPYTKYCVERVLTMMSSGRAFFLRDQELEALVSSVPHANDFLEKGVVTHKDIQKLPQILDFNRYEVEFRGKKGVCIFPEASYFNHMCDANVEISIRHDLTDGFILSARTIRPIEEGEELFINYIPGNDLPLSRFILAMRKRWGFECQCSQCRTRLIGVVFVLFIVLVVPFIYIVRSFFEERFRERARKLQ